MPFPRTLIVIPLTLLLGGCSWMIPRPDHRLTLKESAWGSVRRDTPYVLLRDYETHVDRVALERTSFPPMEELGVLPKGTVIQFTGLNVSRDFLGAQAFVYAKAMSGPNEGRTFCGIGLVETAVDREARKAWMVRINGDAIKPLAGSPRLRTPASAP